MIPGVIRGRDCWDSVIITEGRTQMNGLADLDGTFSVPPGADYVPTMALMSMDDTDILSEATLFVQEKDSLQIRTKPALCYNPWYHTPFDGKRG